MNVFEGVDFSPINKLIWPILFMFICIIVFSVAAHLTIGRLIPRKMQSDFVGIAALGGIVFWAYITFFTPIGNRMFFS